MSNSGGPISAIRKFFQKKKMDTKFKTAGQGHQMAGSSASVARPPGPSRPLSSVGSSHSQRQGLTAEARSAADAALQRMALADKPGRVVQPKMRVDSHSTVTSSGTQPLSPRTSQEAADRKSAQMESSVKFTCDLLPGVKLSWAEMIERIEEYLLASLAEEPQLAAALMIHTLNKDKTRVKVCMDTLCTYLDNIVKNPGEEKFRKIRFGNRNFQERVFSQKGSLEFLQASGFELTKVRSDKDGTEEEFLVLCCQVAEDPSSLDQIKEVLLAAEPIVPELDREVKVYVLKGASAARFENIPPDFYNISKEEVARQQQLQKEAVEKMGMLRTKAMREREEQRELRRYRYTYIRLRFPDHTVLQGTFRASATLGELRAFVRQCLMHEWLPFALSPPHVTGSQVSFGEESDQMSLAELRLPPAAVLNCEFDPGVVSDLVKQQKGSAQFTYLKPELLKSVQVLT